MREKQEGKEEKRPSAERPISLWGASFRDVLGALLRTGPKPKDAKKGSDRNE